jgi:hypothetical protein
MEKKRRSQGHWKYRSRRARRALTAKSLVKTEDYAITLE